MGRSETDDLEYQIKVEATMLAKNLSKLGNNFDFRAAVAKVALRETVMALCWEFKDSNEALAAIDEELDSLLGHGEVTRHFRDSNE